MSHRIHGSAPRTTSLGSTPAVDVEAETQASPRTTRDGFEHEEKPANWTPARATSTRTRSTSPYTLTNRGGSVLTKPVINNIYLGDYWNTAQGKSDAAHNDAFAADVMNSKYMDVLKQYGVGHGSFAGSSVMAGAAPKSVNESDIQAIVKKAIAAGGQSSDPQAIHTVVLPPGTVLTDGSATSLQGLGGYHGSYKGADGKPVYYAAIVYGQGQNGIDFNGKPQDNISVTESHEWAEACTDPDVNSPISGKKLGWYNDNQGEVGDEAINALPLSQTTGTVDGYAVQKEWSNQDKKFEVTPAGSVVTGGRGSKLFG